MWTRTVQRRRTCPCKPRRVSSANPSHFYLSFTAWNDLVRSFFSSLLRFVRRFVRTRTRYLLAQSHTLNRDLPSCRVIGGIPLFFHPSTHLCGRLGRVFLHMDTQRLLLLGSQLWPTSHLASIVPTDRLQPAGSISRDPTTNRSLGNA